MKQPGYSPTRRTLLRAGGGAALVTASLATTAGCSWFGTEPDSAGGSDANPSDSLEAPGLTQLVESGDLPAVEDRLPTNPRVLEPVERAGRYGGTWNTAMVGRSDTAVMRRTIAYEQLVHWTPDWSDIVPNVAERFEVGDDGRIYTFHLREGMKWSDGEPFTAADLVFAVEDVWQNEELYPTPPSWMQSAGAMPQLETDGDYTIRFVFTEPHGLFLQLLATPNATDLTGRPRHYLEKFHRDYNDNVQELVDAEGYADWAEFFDAKRDMFDNPELPTLWPWKPQQGLSDSQRIVAERNPYYWKTDPDGRQLPYIDQVAFDVVEDEEPIVLRISAGEINMHARHVNTLHNKPVLAQSRDEGDFDFFALTPSVMNEMVIALNLAHDDPTLRAVFQNKDFRVGLSHAINRDELIDAVFQRQGVPYQCAPRPESEFYDEELATQYLAFDRGLANEHLDRAGFADRDSDGFRIGPDGNPIRFDIEVAVPSLKDFWVNALELIREQWREVGIDMRIQSEERSLFYERKEANQHDAGVWQGDGGLQDAVLDPRWYMPFSVESIFATPWASWFTSDGTADAAQEPPEPAKRQMELYREFTLTVDADRQAELFREILQIAKEEFYVIGTVMQEENYGIVANNFHNVPEPLPEAYLYISPAPGQPEQFFID